MDSQYHSTAFLPMASAAQHQQHYQSYSGSSNQHQQPSSSSETPTLPPLQAQHNSYGHLPSIYTNSQHTGSPHTPHTPTAAAAPPHQSHSYSHMPNPAPSGSMPPPSSYASATSIYSAAPGYQSANIPTSSSMTSSVGANRLPDLRPAPQNTFNSSFPNFAGSNGMGQGQYLPSQEQEPTHVVGSQGRRGILPSAPGRAAPPTPGAAASAKSMIPAKDADGKFPCPHCNKTYLHAKHLKRHLLRHTGDRPYMCHLCKDTFSRSDILKRHFQKCSIRRGNPTGANHLAHQRRNTNPSNRLSMGTEPIGLAGLANVAGAPQYANGELANPSSSSPTVNGDQSSYASSVASISNRSSRANSLITPGSMHPDGRHAMTGLGIPNLNHNNHNGDHIQATSAPYGAGMPAFSMRPHSASNPLPPGYGYGSAMPNGMYSAVKPEEQHGGNYAPQPGQMHGNWGHMFNTNGQDGFMGQQQQQQHEQQHMPVKAEHGVEGQNYNANDGHNDSFLNGLYSHPNNYADEASR